MGIGLGAATDLGLGDMLASQRDGMTEEEKRRKRLGLSAIGQDALGFGRTGVAAIDLGVAGAPAR